MALRPVKSYDLLKVYQPKSDRMTGRGYGVTFIGRYKAVLNSDMHSLG